MKKIVKSARGVYYDLNKSPYKIIVNDECFRFSSQKKLSMFNTRIKLEEEKFLKIALKLKIYGYNVSKGLEDARLRIPTIVYEKMMYK